MDLVISEKRRVSVPRLSGVSASWWTRGSGARPWSNVVRAHPHCECKNVGSKRPMSKNEMRGNEIKNECAKVGSGRQKSKNKMRGNVKSSRRPNRPNSKSKMRGNGIKNECAKGAKRSRR